MNILFYAASLFTIVRLIWVFFSSPPLLHPENTAYIPFYLSAGWPEKLLDVCAVDSCLMRIRPLGHFLEWLDTLMGAWTYEVSGHFVSHAQWIGVALLAFSIFRLTTRLWPESPMSQRLWAAVYPLSLSPVLIQLPIFFRPGKTWVCYLLVEGLVQILKKNQPWIYLIAGTLPFLDELGFPASLILASTHVLLETTNRKQKLLNWAALGCAVLALRLFLQHLTPFYTLGQIQEFSSLFHLHIREVWRWLGFVFWQITYQFGGLSEWGVMGIVIFPLPFLGAPSSLFKKRLAWLLFGVGTTVYYVMIQRHPPMKWEDVQRAGYYTLFLGVCLYLSVLVVTQKSKMLGGVLVILSLTQMLTFERSRRIALGGHLASAIVQTEKLRNQEIGDLEESYRKLFFFLKERK